MKVNLELNNISHSPLSKRFLKKIVLSALELAKYDFLNRKIIEISVALVDDVKMREINRIYGKKDRTTDVLSFPDYRDKKKLARDNNRSLFSS